MLHLVMVGIEWSVDIEVIDMASDDISGNGGSLAEGVIAHIERLGGRHQLDPEDAAGVVENLEVLDSRIHSHRNEVFLIRRRWNRLHRCGSGENALFDDKRISGILAQH